MSEPLADLVGQFRDAALDAARDAAADPVLTYARHLRQGVTSKALYDIGLRLPAPNVTPTKFHRSQARERWLCGGNQSSKTETVTWDTLMQQQDVHPFRKRPDEGMRVRWYALDFNKIREIIIPKIVRMLKPGVLNEKRGRNGYNSDSHIMYLKSPHGGQDDEFHLATYDQDLHKAEGGEFHRVNYDEPPPHMLYDANKIRTVSLGGIVSGAMTPLEEQIPWDVSWIFHEIVAKANGTRVAVWYVDTDENAHNLVTEDYEEFKANLTPEQRDVRLRGHFAFLKGLVYKQFDAEIHVCDAFDVHQRVKDGQGQLYCALDHGMKNPTACIWFYCTGSGLDTQAYVYREYLETGLLVSENVERIAAMSRGEPIITTFADASMWSENEQTGKSNAELYLDAGLSLDPSDRSIRVEQGHAEVAEWLRVFRDKDGKTWRENPEVPVPRLMFFRDACPECVAAMQRYIYQPTSSRRAPSGGKEKPAEQFKHLPDCIRYFCTACPVGTPMGRGRRLALHPVTGAPLKKPVTPTGKNQRMRQAELAAFEEPASVRT